MLNKKNAGQQTATLISLIGDLKSVEQSLAKNTLNWEALN
jgi:hypothetical protein